MQLRNDDVENNFEIKSNVLFAHSNAKDIQVFIFTIILTYIWNLVRELESVTRSGFKALTKNI